MVRPVKSFAAILNAVVMELQRTHGAKVKLTLEIDADAPAGFADAVIGFIRDNWFGEARTRSDRWRPT